MKTKFKWEKRDVLEHAHIYLSVETGDGHGNTYRKSSALCKRLVDEGLLRQIAYGTYGITDLGREWVVGVR